MLEVLSGIGVLTGVFLASLAALVAGMAVGSFLGRRRRAALVEGEGASMLSLQGSALALMALILGFTFAAGIGRFDLRNAILLNEANAIGTALLRSEFLPEPYAAPSAALLKEYLALRIVPPGQDLEHAAMRQRLSRSAELHSRMWKIAVAATQAATNPLATGLYSQALNQVIDLHTTRLMAARNRIPREVLVALFVLSMISLGLVAYDSTVQGKRGRVGLAVTAVLMAGVLTVIVDLDAPWFGFLSGNQSALVDLLQSVSASNR
jgi:hypothetical protein